MGTLTEEQFNELCQIIIDTGSWRFAGRAKTIDKESASMAMFSIIKQTKQVASEFGVDIFNLPAQLQFNFMQFQQNNAVPILKSYYKQYLLEINVLNDRYRPPKTLFGIPDFAMSWGYVNDVRLLLAARDNGLVVSQYGDKEILKLTIDVNLLPDIKSVVDSLQQRLDSLTSRLQLLPSQQLKNKLEEDGLHTNQEYDQIND